MWWLVFPIAFLCFLGVLFLRAAMFSPEKLEEAEENRAQVNEERAKEALCEMLKVKTVSYRDRSLEDGAAFARFAELMKERYPLVHERAECGVYGEHGLFYCLKGKGGGEPAVLMAHYDVVPEGKAEWKHPPFGGVVEDGVLYGRGALDTKVTLCAAMEALETLLEKGFCPKGDLYLCFGGNEEVSGSDAPAMAKELKRRGVSPVLVLDEGGAMVEGAFPGVKERCAMVGIGEKGMMNLELRVDAKGGHASTPPKKSPADRLARAICRLHDHPFPARLTPATLQLFDCMGRKSSFLFRLLFANLWCFAPLLKALCGVIGGEMNALCRTTQAFTMLFGGDAPNVLPQSVSANVNLRLLAGDSVQGVLERAKKVIGDEEVQLRVVDGHEASNCSRADGKGWEILSSTIRQSFSGVQVSPYLMIAGSDSRHYELVSDSVYRFCPLFMTAEERKLIHSVNERIPLQKLYEAVGFYQNLIEKL